MTSMGVSGLTAPSAQLGQIVAAGRVTIPCAPLQRRTVEREPRRVHVYEAHVRAVWPAGTEMLHAGTRVLVDFTCSKGTYIRTLCHDIGARLLDVLRLSGDPRAERLVGLYLFGCRRRRERRLLRVNGVGQAQRNENGTNDG